MTAARDMLALIFDPKVELDEIRSARGEPELPPSFDEAVLDGYLAHVSTVPRKRRTLQQHVEWSLESGPKTYTELLNSGRRMRVKGWWLLSRKLRAMAKSGLIAATVSSDDIRETSWAAVGDSAAPSPPMAITREQRRSRRKREVRARTVSVKRMTKRELELGALLYPERTAALRPRTRGECSEFGRPCPFVSCTHHLYIDVSRHTGAIKLNFPDLEPGEIEHSCSLDVADLGGTVLEDVGAIMNITRERVRQIEVKALAKRKRASRHLEEYANPGERGKRRLPVLEAST